MRAIVTGGGTLEPIDDVRVITNISKGTFAIEIARALSAAGIDTLLLGSDSLGTTTNDARGEAFAFKRFRTYSDLDRELDAAIGDTPPDFIFMAAAVSDYRPIPFEGKLSSGEEELVIRCRKNPKLLARLREKCGVKTFLVGFKLLSNVSKQELVSVALKQTKNNRLNLTVANDLKDLQGASAHPVQLVTAEGGAIPVTGPRREVAQEIVRFALKRAQVQWFHTEYYAFPEELNETTRERADRLLQFAQSSRLLHDSNGNISVRDSNLHSILVSARQIDKGTMTIGDFAVANVDPHSRVIHSFGRNKSSIDTGVQDYLYRALPRINSFLHFHAGEALVAPSVRTTFPYPCGTVEEAAEILSTLASVPPRDPSPFTADGSFLVELQHHGYLLGLTEPTEAKLCAEWENTVRAHRAHIGELNLSETPQMQRSPLLNGPSIVGTIVSVQLDDGPATSLYLPKSFRAAGSGSIFTRQIRDRGDRVIAHADCAVQKYYEGWGYEKIFEKGNVCLLRSPVGRTDLIKCATVCLINPVDHTVLLGKRTAGVFLHVYAFPGGHVEEGETRFQAVIRELGEETGIWLQSYECTFRPEPEQEYTTFGSKVFDVQTFVGTTFASPTPTQSDELDAQWIPFEKAFHLPLGPGTKRLLRKILSGK